MRSASGAGSVEPPGRTLERNEHHIVSYGSYAAGYRAAEQLRQVLIELRVAPIRAQVGVPAVWEAFDEAGHVRQPGLNQSLDAMLDELAWWARALKVARNSSVPA